MAYLDLIGTRKSMGHSDIKTTMLYVHEDRSRSRAAAAQWCAELNSQTQPDVTTLVPEAEKSVVAAFNG